MRKSKHVFSASPIIGNKCVEGHANFLLLSNEVHYAKHQRRDDHHLCGYSISFLQNIYTTEDTRETF